MGPGHGGQEAWDLGYRGDGVRVAVLDTGVDFAHADISGTWAVLPEGHAYAGWPQAYDPYSTYYFTLDHTPGSDTDFAGLAFSGLVRLSQTSAVISQTVGSEGKWTACLQPLVWSDPDADERTLGPQDCDTRVPASRSGQVRYGHHPDQILAGLSAAEDQPAEFAGVLLVDAHTAGVYDTVYVDVDGDHDFTDEKPVTKADPLSARDTDGDGIADLSGGLLYYIADGQLPVPAAWLWGLEDEVPEAYSYVGLLVDQGEHGTLCASDIVSQGVLGMPPGVDLAFRDRPDGIGALNPALAPGARVVAVGDVYGPDLLFETAWRYAVLGTDPDSPDDDIQVVSNSYGWSGVDNEGWDLATRYMDYYVRRFSPSTTFLVATGNGAPGYGTLNSPLPVTGIAVGASTQEGHTGTDSITDTAQITFGDVTAFSDRGPASDTRVGVDVVANGAGGVGAVPVNMVYDPDAEGGGANALVTWAGTSRSAPVASAALALVYQAYQDQHGAWPDWRAARSLLMGGARFNGQDAFTAGAGTVDAGDAVRLAAKRGGLRAEPPSWTAGSWRGQIYPGFAKVMLPGQSETQAITVTNASTVPVTADVSVQALRRLAYFEGSLTTDLGAESPYNPNVPDYLVPIDDNRVPNGTHLMVVRFAYPLSELDPEGNLVVANDFRPGVIRHTDVDGDGRLWDDVDGNGVVNHEDLDDEVTGLDGLPAVDWSRTELDRWEYARFDRSSADSNTAAISVHHPVERWGDGLYLALWHRRGPDQVVPVRATHIQYRVEFYSYSRQPWFTVSRDRLDVPANGQAQLFVTLLLPRETRPGAYQAALFLDYVRPAGDVPIAVGGGFELEDRRLVVPIGAHVAARYGWQGSLSLGNSAANDWEVPYNNGAVRGLTDWGWDRESGDWRLFFLESLQLPAPGTWWLVKTGWSDPSRQQTDLDTRLWGPAADPFTDPADPAGGDKADPAWYGPYSLAKVGESDDHWQGAGRWRFHTATGTNEDWVAGPATGWTAADGSGDGGLTALMLQNVLYSGAQLEVPFTVEVSSFRLTPAPLSVRADVCRWVWLTSEVDLTGFSIEAVGLSGPPEVLAGLPVSQDDPNDVETSSLRHAVTLDSQAARFAVTLSGPPAADLDLYVLRDGDGDGTVTYPDDVVGSSLNGGSDEAVTLPGVQPPGELEIWVHGYQVPGGQTTADLTVDIVRGTNVAVQGAPEALAAGETAAFKLCPHDVEGLPDGARGVLLLGPGVAPQAVRVPFTWDGRPAARLILPWLGRSARRDR